MHLLDCRSVLHIKPADIYSASIIDEYAFDSINIIKLASN